MRPLLLTAALLASTSAVAARPYHPAPTRAPAVCEAGELRVSTPDNAWYDLEIDGVTRVEARNQRTVQSLPLRAGRHIVRVTDFMGELWSQQVVDIGCGETVVTEVYDDHGLEVLASYGNTPTRPTRPAAQRPGDRRPTHRPSRPARVCTTGSLSISPVDGAWYDVFVDGEKVVQSRSFDGRQTLDLAPGTHHVRVQSFVGEVWSSSTLDIPCNGLVVGDVYEDRGLRLL